MIISNNKIYMKKNIFICHRPYHILRSCDFIYRNTDTNTLNVLISFDVKLSGQDVYQRFSKNDIFNSLFDEVIHISRAKVPPVRSFLSFYKFCKNKRREYFSYIRKHLNPDELYFFCDDEVEIQLLIGLFLENKKDSLKSILVDEGMVTYSHRTHNSSWKHVLYIKLITKIIGLKYYNSKGAYGSSNFYNYSYANKPDKAFFKQPINQMPVISEQLCTTLRNRINFPISPNNYYIYVTTPITPFDKEKEVIYGIKNILSKYGIPIYLKLHPQQDEDFYKSVYSNEYFIDKSYPIELFFSSSSIVGGIGSSSIYNAVLQGYNAMDLSLLFDKKDLSFVSLYGWLDITTIESYEAFEKLLKIMINR